VLEALAQPRAPAMCVAFRGADGHSGRCRDLFERIAECVLQQHDLRLLRRDVGERATELAPQLGVPGGTRRIVRRLEILRERLVRTRLAALRCVEAGVHNEPVEPRRELRTPAELLQPHAYLRERLLGRIVRILGVTEDPPREPLDSGAVASEQSVERTCVSVLRPLHEHRVAQPVVRERVGLPQLERDRAAAAHGASLDPVSDLAPEAVLPLLRGRFGRTYRFVPSCPSTQRLLADGDPEGAVVATDHQTAGRGRLGRVWHDAPGRALLLSVLLRPDVPMPLWPELSLVAGEAVAEALRAVGVAAALRYPNDVVVAGRKLVGVLPEASSGRVVLGIGANVNQTIEELPPDTVKPPTSLRIELGHEVERAPLLAAVLAELERGYDAWLAQHRR
jgi:biotin-[acetyl-CoA-carboxylase] ligase BirA-like protein